MQTVAIIIILAVAVAAVVLYIRRAETNTAALNQRDATLAAEQERRHATEAAEAKAAAERKAAFDGEARKVVTADDAIDLLRKAANNTGN